MGRLGEGIMDVLSKAVGISHGILREEKVENSSIWWQLEFSVQGW